MKITRIAASAAFALILALQAYPAEGSKAEVAPVGPPQPRILEPLRPNALPPRAADPSWLLYQEGMRLFAEKRLGESLASFKKAIDSREALFDRAAKDISAATATKEALQAQGSLSRLVELLAARELIPQELEALRAKAAGSLLAELGLLRERSPSRPLHGLLDAALLVVEERGLARVGDSVAALAKATEELARYPEAEFWISKIYLAEGESRLAELQAIRAYGMSGSLEVTDDRFSILQALADIYRARGDGKDYELRLREIADASDLFAGKDEYYRNAMERTLALQGFDKFMALYRVEDRFAIAAYSQLGALYLEAGRPLAVGYLAAAVNAVLTREIAAIKADSPGFAYKDLPDLASRILAGEDTARFASESGLWRDLVRLGEALSASGNRETAREIWAAVSRALGASDPWGKRAAAFLISSRNASRRP